MSLLSDSGIIDETDASVDVYRQKAFVLKKY